MNNKNKIDKTETEYKPIIGIEVHVELKTKSKMFCSCEADHFQVAPNTHTCPVCLGLPGALPVPNKQAIEWCLLIGLSLGCKLNKDSHFDRKNYFYPDLAKGYQISQYSSPFCQNGKLEIQKGSSFLNKTVRINRVHLEEDTGKLIHDQGDYTLVDFNRCGVPLVEIVTEPDINSSQEAVEYLKKLQQIIRYLGVSSCDMEKGSMRCEINISLLMITQNSNVKSQNHNSKRKTLLPSYKVEVKNINSFKFVKKAIEFEIKRQKEFLKQGETPLQETRGFNSAKGITYSQRSKEEAHDYRYFPEPDIPPIKLTDELISKLSNQLTELPDQKIKRFIKQYGLNEYQAKILCLDQKTAQYFETAVKPLKNSKDFCKIANLIINKKIDLNKIKAEKILDYLNDQRKSLITNEQELEAIINKIIKVEQKAFSDYKKGKKEVLGFLIGQVIRATKGKADAGIVRKILIRK